MANSTSKPMTIRPSIKTIEVFRNLFQESGSNSQGEFLEKLCDRWLTPAMSNILDANPVTPETPLQQEERLLGLSQEETNEFLALFQSSGISSISEFLKSLFEKWVNPEKAIESEPEPILLQEPEHIQSELKPNEILLCLTPAQMFAIRETVSAEGFAEDQNEIIDSLNYKKPGNSYYGQISEPDFELLWVRNIVFAEGMTPEEKETAIRHNMAAFIVNMFFVQLLRGKISEVTNVTAKSLKTFIRELSEDAPCEFSVRSIKGRSQTNEMILGLTQAQLYAIRETVLTEGFAEKNNEVTDSLKPENKPFLYFGNLFEPEFQSLWIKNIVLTDELSEEEKEIAIRHNMTAFLINMFLMHLIEGKISVTSVTAKALIAFIQEQDQDQDSLVKAVN